jgi:hypothetical protein
MIFLPPKSGSVLAGGAVVTSGAVVAAGAQATARNDSMSNRLTIRKAFILFSFFGFLQHGNVKHYINYTIKVSQMRMVNASIGYLPELHLPSALIIPFFHWHFGHSKTKACCSSHY